MARLGELLAREKEERLAGEAQLKKEVAQAVVQEVVELKQELFKQLQQGGCRLRSVRGCGRCEMQQRHGCVGRLPWRHSVPASSPRPV